MTLHRILLIQGDARKIALPDESVQCVATSPPYFGLRDYGTAEWVGGDPECDHVVGEIRTGLGMAALGEKYRGGGKKVSEPKPMTAKGTCPKCGAVRKDTQIGLENSLAEYLESMCLVFDEVWRVLRPDGTVFLNMGDSYAGSGKGGQSAEKRSENWQPVYGNKGVVPDGFKPKDLMGVPWRLAFALQDRGWWLRSDIIWHKPNPMPESVTDRPTRSHEYIFLLSKSKTYFYDSDAIRENKAPATTGDNRTNEDGHRRDRQFPGGPSVGGTNLGGPTGGRNKRTVWKVSTKSYAGAHFATFPPDLIEPCILAGTSEKGQCPECGAPWERVTNRELVPTKKAAKTFIYDDRDKAGHEQNDQSSNRQRDGHKPGYITAVETTGWRPTCEHEHEPVPQIVLDPFGGSGTTAMVANQHGRIGISNELSIEYVYQAQKRTGLKELKEWTQGKQATQPNITDLPLFSYDGETTA